MNACHINLCPRKEIVCDPALGLLDPYTALVEKFEAVRSKHPPHLAPMLLKGDALLA